MDPRDLVMFPNSGTTGLMIIVQLGPCEAATVLSKETLPPKAAGKWDFRQGAQALPQPWLKGLYFLERRGVARVAQMGSGKLLGAGCIQVVDPAGFPSHGNRKRNSSLEPSADTRSHATFSGGHASAVPYNVALGCIRKAFLEAGMNSAVCTSLSHAPHLPLVEKLSSEKLL